MSDRLRVQLKNNCGRFDGIAVNLRCARSFFQLCPIPAERKIMDINFRRGCGICISRHVAGIFQQVHYINLPASALNKPHEQYFDNIPTQGHTYHIWELLTQNFRAHKAESSESRGARSATWGTAAWCFQMVCEKLIAPRCGRDWVFGIERTLSGRPEAQGA